jgi:hypothetical protein
VCCIIQQQIYQTKIIVVTVVKCTGIEMGHSCSCGMEFGVFVEKTISVSVSHFCL